MYDSLYLLNRPTKEQVVSIKLNVDFKNIDTEKKSGLRIWCNFLKYKC